MLTMLAIAALTAVRAQLATSPWPMFHHDLAHTGLSPYDTSANNGTLKWKFTTSGDIGYSSPAIGSDGTIYVGSIYVGVQTVLYALNPDGSQKWNTALGQSDDYDFQSSPAIGSDGTIYVADAGGTLDAINPDGTLKWGSTLQTGSGLESSPVISADGTIYVGGAGGLVALNPDGIVKWSSSSGGPVNSSPAVGSDGTIYVGSNDHNLYAINPDGTQKWAFTTGNAVESSPAIGADATIYVASFDGNLYAITKGTKKWAFAIPFGDLQSSPAIRL